MIKEWLYGWFYGTILVVVKKGSPICQTQRDDKCLYVVVKLGKSVVTYAIERERRGS